jgi:hypothetical protein
MTRRKQNASGKGGAPFTKLAGGANGGKKKLYCGVKHTADIRRELQRAGLALRSTSGATQRTMLLRVLQHLGARGINTPEAVDCGYCRVASRIQELEADGWQIASLRESIIGADGLPRIGIARYVLLGRQAAPAAGPQFDLGLEGA